MRFFLSIILIILVSCGPNPTKLEDTFDLPLITQNERFRFAGEYDSLVNLNKEYYKKADKINFEDGKALCYINLAEVNVSLGNFPKAQFFFDDAKQILEQSDNNIHKAKFYNSYSRFISELKKNDKAFEYNEEAMNFIKNSGNSKLKNSILINIYLQQADYLIGKKQYDKALENLHKAGKLDESGRADCATADNYIYVYRNLDSTRAYLSKAYEKMNRQKRRDIITLYINTIMGEYYIANQQYDKAGEVLQQALEINKKTSRIFAGYTKYIYNDLRVVYEQKGETEKAYFYLKAYTEAKNQMNTSIQKTINQDMESFIKETKEASEKHENHMRWVVFVSLTTFLVLGVYAWRSIKLLREKRKILKKEAEELKNRINDNKQEEIMELAKNNDPEFLNRFKEIYPNFINTLLVINPDLENSELIFCAMLKLHFTSKEIALYTLVQHRSVQQKKYRIRKRLNIPKEIDTYHFFDDLI